MSPALVVLLTGLAAALVAFGLSASRHLHIDPFEPADEERAARRSLWRHPRIARFLRERMDRRTAGGFLLTASIIVLFVVSIFVGVLLDMIDNHSGLAAADRSVASWGSRNGSSTTAQMMKWVTQLGSTPAIAAALLVTSIVDYLRRHSREVFAFVAAVGVGEFLLNNLLKVIVHRERPSVLRLVAAHGYSFPSGHTVAATSGWLAIALILGRDRSRTTRALLSGAAALIAVSVAASRALLGVHWLTDVLAGLVIGGGWFMIVAIVFGGRAQRLGDPVSGPSQRERRPPAIAAGSRTPASSPGP
ncbi:MAG: phosphatase PAP2 family protein [Ilumatobacteraceae bacterium]